MRISRISPAAFALFFIVQFLFARPVLCDIAGAEVELAPALPAHARVEPGEDIFYYSTLPDGAEWAVFPGVLGATDGVKIRGLAEGEGWLCGRNGGRVAIIRLTVKKLTPTDHEILVGLRRELSGSNTYKNQLEKADARLRDARTKMNMFPARFTDYEIRAKPAREKCDVSLNILLDNLPRLRRALSALEDSLESHAETAASLKPPTSKSGRGTPKILLPPGYSIGRYVVYPEALPIYGAGDWTRIVGFELDNRMKLEPGYNELMRNAAALENAVREFDGAAAEYVRALGELGEIRNAQAELPALAATAQAELDDARAAKLAAMFGEKENGRRVEELQLWYQFRRWLATRTGAESAERGLFTVRTDDFRTRLGQYRKELSDSLATIDRLEKAAPESAAAMPEIPAMPANGANNDLLEASGAFSISLSGEVVQNALFPDTLPAYMARMKSLDEAAGINRLALFESGTIPPGFFTSSGESYTHISVSDLETLASIQTEEAAFSGDFPRILPEMPRIRGLNLQDESAQTAGLRSSLYKAYLAELARYERESAAYAEAETARSYRPAVESSLETLITIMNYLDWRLEYVRLVHGGGLNRRGELALALKEWERLLGAEPRCTRDDISRIYAKLTSAGAGDAPAFPDELIDFCFPGVIDPGGATPEQNLP